MLSGGRRRGLRTAVVGLPPVGGAFLVYGKHLAGPEGRAKILSFASVGGEQVRVKHNFESSGCLLVEFWVEPLGGDRLVRLPVQTCSVYC